MTHLQDGNIVAVMYTGALEDGTVFDSNQNREPLQFQLGQGQVIPGFEEGVRDMEVGQTKTITLPPEKAYGQPSPQNVVAISPDQVSSDLDLHIGQRLELSQEDGRAIPVIVTEIADDRIVLDANHPLAGKTLIFEIKLVNVG